MFAPRMQYRDGRPNDPTNRLQAIGLPRLPDVTLLPRPGAYTDRRARPPISVRPVRRPQPFQPQPFQPQPAPPQFGQVEEQPQFNQQGMQQMMQMMQQMMQMISQFSNQGGFGGGFGGGYGGGMGGGFGRGYGSMGGPFGQMMRPRPRPMFDYFSQNPFTRY